MEQKAAETPQRRGRGREAETGGAATGSELADRPETASRNGL